MDEQARIRAGAMSAPERSTSRIGDRGRRIAIAEEEGLFQADRSTFAARWQHPLVKSIEAKQGKASQMWVAVRWLWHSVRGVSFRRSKGRSVDDRQREAVVDA